VRWIRARAKEYNFDRERVGVWGASAGGHLAALLGTTGGMKAVEGNVGGNLEESSRVQAVCDFFGPATLEAAAFAGTAGGRPPAGLDMVRQLLGGTPEDKPQLARLASPLAHVTRDDPPFLIVHGSKDLLVSPRQSELLAAALRKAGVEVTLHVVKDAGHGMGVRTAEVDRMVAAFFAKHLKPGASAPATKPAQMPSRKPQEAKKARKAA
jgi:acetyl esterase/lipase